MKKLENLHGIYFEDYGFDSTILIQLTLYLFQKVIDNRKQISYIESSLYGTACFGIAFKYISDSFNGNILSFIKNVTWCDITELIEAEHEVLKIIDYKIPLDLSDISLTPELNLVLKDVIVYLG